MAPDKHILRNNLRSLGRVTLVIARGHEWSTDAWRVPPHDTLQIIECIKTDLRLDYRRHDQWNRYSVLYQESCQENKIKLVNLRKQIKSSTLSVRRPEPEAQLQGDKDLSWPPHSTQCMLSTEAQSLPLVVTQANYRTRLLGGYWRKSGW